MSSNTADISVPEIETAIASLNKVYSMPSLRHAARLSLVLGAVLSTSACSVVVAAGQSVLQAGGAAADVVTAGLKNRQIRGAVKHALLPELAAFNHLNQIGAVMNTAQTIDRANQAVEVVQQAEQVLGVAQVVGQTPEVAPTIDHVRKVIDLTQN